MFREREKSGCPTERATCSAVISFLRPGMQQTLLLLAHLRVNPGSVRLLDAPDAHLEILRQRQVYQIFSRVAGKNKITSDHCSGDSESVLNEAAGRGRGHCFLGKPHRMTIERANFSSRSVRLVSRNYYQAEQTGWVLILRPTELLSCMHLPRD